ncbi:MAG: dTDP-4-dehydrorhamnose 3,5-epimerase [Bdellovibrionaceae bacterium]|nr:dTDP-4-dehydrorhamnose 3,5-epimerase [Pseudobdellovibrionaceae bacterium]|tara:strand:+ start:1578 stop:2132 length:555 start_codon:yes stop_codon:yes gene_type:complete
MFKIESCSINDVKLITPQLFPDERGLFFENYKLSELESFGLPIFVQDNVSKSGKNVLRGLHLQLEPFEQGKLVSILKGKVLDVCVDLRPHSESFLRYFSTILDDEHHKMLYVPPGFAHGFYTFSDENIMLYKNTIEYNPSYEVGLLWDDPELSIEWPSSSPIVSDRDSKLLSLEKFRKKYLSNE